MVRRLVATAKDLFHLYRADIANFVAHHVPRIGTTTALTSTSAFTMSPCLARPTLDSPRMHVADSSRRELKQVP